MSHLRPSAQGDDPPRADAQRNREAVLQAAIGLLGERPGASMRAIADASGVGRSTVYRHFPTREALLRALFARVLEESAAAGHRDGRQRPLRRRDAARPRLPHRRDRRALPLPRLPPPPARRVPRCRRRPRRSARALGRRRAGAWRAARRLARGLDLGDGPGPLAGDDGRADRRAGRASTRPDGCSATRSRRRSRRRPVEGTPARPRSRGSPRGCRSSWSSCPRVSAGRVARMVAWAVSSTAAGGGRRGGATRSSTRSIRARSRTLTATASATCRGSPPVSTTSRRSASTRSGCRPSTPRRWRTSATTCRTSRPSTPPSARSPTSTRCWPRRTRAACAC